MLPLKLKIPPGLYRNGTLYQAIGRWYDGSWVRWFSGAMRPVGGFQTLAVVGAQVAHDAFTGTIGTGIVSHPPDSGFTAWEPYLYTSTTMSLDGSGAVRADGALPDATHTPVLSTGSVAQDAYTATWVFFRGATSGSDGVQCIAIMNAKLSPTDFVGVYVIATTNDTTYAISYTYDRDDQGSGSGTLATGIAWADETTFQLNVDCRAGVYTVTYSVNAGATQTAGTFTTLPLTTFNESTHKKFGFHLYTTTSTLLTLRDFTVAQNVKAYPRSLLGWRKTSGQAYLAIGTTDDLFSFTQGQLTKITPAAGLTAGYINTTLGTGAYGTGNYGAGAYGTGDPTQTTEIEASTWQFDVIPLDAGDQLVAVRTSDGTLWTWDPANAAAVAATGGAPINNTGVVVTPEQFLVALGAGGTSRVVQWADQSSTSVWTPSSSNQAGNFILAGAGQLMCGRRGRNETLLWTDTGLWAMRFIGGTLVYSFDELGSGCGVISRQAVAMIEAGKAVWMGQNRFFLYEGFVQPIDCDVEDKVFGDFNHTQRHKIVSFTVEQFAEVWWLYCSAASDEPDRYVTWNHVERHWSFGALTRTAGIDRGAFQYPFMADSTGVIYQHENGTTHTGLSPFAESGPVELTQDPDRVLDIVRVVPDEANLGDVRVKLITSYTPTGPETTSSAFTAAQPTDVRVNGRLVRLRLDESVVGDWRVGDFRLNAIPQGSR